VLHGLVLSGWPTVAGREPPRREAGVQVRALPPETAVAVAAEAPEPVVPATEPASPTPRPTAEARPAAAAAATTPVGTAAEVMAPASAPTSAPGAEPSAPSPEPVPIPVEQPAPPRGDLALTAASVDLVAPLEPPASTALATPSAPDGVALGAMPSASAPLPVAETGEPLPVYPTRFAPSQVLSYQLRRGLLGGTAVLDWQRGEPGEAGARYRMQLVARAAGLVLLTQESEGGFDAAGLAPRRFTDQRLRGSARAANFLKERGLISFSGPSVEYAWVPGVQDRLSWMLQLPAIVEANPRLASVGERITLAVVGARGDATVWVFRFVAAETVPTAAGEVRALKFIREPRKPNDTQAEVWLDPARHHLPVRSRIGNPPDGEVLDLRLDVP
jgi:Protein of unknown function (DUF3108)